MVANGVRLGTSRLTERVRLPKLPFRSHQIATFTGQESGVKSGHSAKVNERPMLGSGEGCASVRVWV